MKQVSLRDANQNFSSYVAEVEAGETLVLLRRGRPVARIVPISRKLPRDREHEKAVSGLMNMLRDGFDLGGLRVDRDEIHDRGR